MSANAFNWTSLGHFTDFTHRVQVSSVALYYTWTSILLSSAFFGMPPALLALVLLPTSICVCVHRCIDCLCRHRGLHLNVRVPLDRHLSHRPAHSFG